MKTSSRQDISDLESHKRQGKLVKDLLSSQSTAQTSNDDLVVRVVAMDVQQT